MDERNGEGCGVPGELVSFFVLFSIRFVVVVVVVPSLIFITDESNAHEGERRKPESVAAFFQLHFFGTPTTTTRISFGKKCNKQFSE